MSKSVTTKKAQNKKNETHVDKLEVNQNEQLASDTVLTDNSSTLESPEGPEPDPLEPIIEQSGNENQVGEIPETLDVNAEIQSKDQGEVKLSDEELAEQKEPLENIVSIPVIGNTRPKFKNVVPTFNETPTKGMEVFGALFNPDGNTSDDIKNQHFAALYDYVNNRKTGNEILNNNIQFTLSKIGELNLLIQQLDTAFEEA